MSDENVLDKAAEQQDSTDDQSGVSPDIEEKARGWGWRPKDEFDGPEELWKPADEFVEIGENVLPVVRAEKRKLEGMLAEERNARKAEQKDFQKRIEAIDRTSRIALERQRKNIVAQYDRDKREAASLGDMDAYDAAQQQEQQELQSLDDEVAKQPDADEQGEQQQFSADDQKAANRWVAENAWFNSDEGMRRQAITHLEILTDDMPSATMAERLAEVKKRIQGQYPDKFSNGGGGGPHLEGGSRGGANRGSGNMTSRLPPEAKEAGKRFVEEGSFKSIDEYAKAYFEQEDAT